MLQVVLHGLAGRKLRTVLTSSAIVLGVALVSGTFILTDTLDRSFNRIFSTAYSGFDVAVTPKKVVEQQNNSDQPPISQRYVDEVRAVPGVKAAVGAIFTEAVVYGKDGKRLTTHAPNFISSTAPKPFDPFNYVQGHAPTADNQVAIDAHTARQEHFKLGQLVSVSGEGPRQRFRLVGIAKFGDVDSLAGAAVAVMTLPQAQRMTGRVGEVDQVQVLADRGISPAQLRSRVRAALPPTLSVRTANQEAKTQAKDTANFVGFIKTALLVFAGVALFVGAFMIFNTFSITVAQRTREFAMLRTLGASRRQVLRSVVLEGALIGLAASLVGLAAGFGLAPGLRALFKLFGGDLPQQGTVFEARTAIVAIVVGTVMTVVASLFPALRATRVPPVAALREGAELPAGRGRRWRTPVAVGLTVIGVVIIAYGLFGDVGSGGSVAGLLGAGAVVVFLGVAMMSAKLVPPLASLVGAPLQRWRGISGRLAKENAIRNPGRTAGTAAALMIGLALVTFVAIFAAGTRGSVDKAIDEGFRSQLVLQNTDGFSTFGGAVNTAVERVPGVAFASPLRFSESKVLGVNKSVSATGVDPRTAAQVFHLKWKHGSQATLAALGSRDAVVDNGWAKDHHVKVGDLLHVITPRAVPINLRVSGLYEDRLDFGGDYIVPNQTMTTDYGVTQEQFSLVALKPGADLDTTKRAVERVLDNQFPAVEALTHQEFKDDQAKQINQLLGLIYVLLGLSVIVSLFGIVNTLALSIHERTRELGMLRAVGTSRAQVRRMVRYESVITALIGAVLGTVLGVFFAIIISRPLADEGFSLSFPVGTLIILLILAAIAGVLAAIGPARRASRLNVLEALAYE